MTDNQLESIKMLIASIKDNVTAEDKQALVSSNVCSMGTIDKYVTKGEARNYTLARNIYKFLKQRIDNRKKNWQN
jgi:hypothetical protein